MEKWQTKFACPCFFQGQVFEKTEKGFICENFHLQGCYFEGVVMISTNELWKTLAKKKAFNESIVTSKLQLDFESILYWLRTNWNV